MLGELSSGILKLNFEPINLFLFSEMVPFEEFRFDLFITISNRSSDLEQINVGDVVISLPSKVFLTKVSGQLWSNQLKVFLTLTITLLSYQQPSLGLDEIHHQSFQGFIQNIAKIFRRHRQFGL